MNPATKNGDLGKRQTGDHFGTYYWTDPGEKKVISASFPDKNRILISDYLEWKKSIKLKTEL